MNIEEIEEKESNKETKIEKKLRSTHIFIFPFKIINETKTEDKKSRKERVLKDEKDWEEYTPYNSQVETDKNLMKYFNKYAKDSLFRYGNDFNDKYVGEFHHKKIKSCKFTICYKEKKYISGVEKVIERNYILDIEEIRIKFFDTSIGTLSFVLNNYDYSEISDVLLINNQGRKIYLAYETEECSKIKIEGIDFQIYQDISESTIIYEGQNEFLHNNKIIDYFINLREIEPMLDDRMYTMCQYLQDDDEIKKQLNLENNQEKVEELIREKAKNERIKYWYQYTYIDEPNLKMCQNINLEKELIKKSSYMRWEDWGTCYGISRYSFMLWTRTNFKEKNNFSLNVLNKHLKTLYFQMLSLLIAQKSTIVLLNEKINNLLEKNSSEENEYNEYLNYLSKLNFREITHQEQGIEIYNLCRNQMDIQMLTEELNLKVKTLNDKAERDRDKEEAEAESKQQKTIENFGLFLAILGTIFGILGISETYLNTTSKIIISGVEIEQENWYGFFVRKLRDYSGTVFILLALFFIVYIAIKIYVTIKNKK